MSPLKQSTDNILYAYSQCIHWYDCVDQRRTRLRFENLKSALSVFQLVMNNHMDLLNEEGYSANDSPILQDWYYSHNVDHSGQYLCPAEVIQQFNRFLEE